MPIRSIDDLRKQVGPDWNDVSDEDLISSYAKSIEADPAAVAYKLGFGLEEGGKNSKRLSSSIDRYQAGLYGAGEEVTKAVGLDTASEWLGKQRRANELRADTDSLRAQQLGAVDAWKDVNNLSDFGDYAVGLGIQSAPYLGESLVGGIAARGLMGGTRAALRAADAAGDVAAATKAKRALDIGSTAGATAASYPSSVGDILSNQREQAGQTDPLSAFGLGVPYAAANAVGLEGAAARASLFRNTINLLDKPGGLAGAALRAGATGVTTGLKEGASETFQEGMNQLGRMAVDPTESFLSDAAQERFKESFIGGAVLGGGTASALGGWRRSQPVNDIQQAFQSEESTNVVPPVSTAPVTPAAPVAPAAPPAVAGGTTDIAQATQAAQAQDAAAEQALQQQAAREQVYEQFGIANPEDPTKGQFFGQKLFGPAVNQVADAMVAATQKMPPIQQELARAVTFANAETGNQLVKFAFNAADPAKSVAKALEAVGKVLTKFQIGHVQSAEEAGQILNTLSENAKGQQLEQINAMHVALTGEDTSGFLAVQNATTAKGAKDGKLQMQNPAGVGTVREQGPAGIPAQGNAGDVRPGGVQPVDAGSVLEGSLGLQVGQPAGEGVRPGTGGTALAGDGSVVAQAPQVTDPKDLLRNLPNGGFGPEGDFSADERKLTYDMVDKIVRDGLAADKSNIEILDQIDRTTNQSLSTAAVTELDRYLTRARKGEPYAPRIQTAPAQAVGTSPAGEAAANEPNAPQSGDAGNRADVLQGGASAEQAEEDVTDSVGTLLRNVLKMVFRSEKKVEFLATFVRKQNDVTYEELGQRLGLSKNTIKQYQKLLRVDEATGLPEFIAQNFDKFQQALKIQSEMMGVDLAELRTALSDLAAQDDAAAAGVAEENDLINNGLAIQELKERKDKDGKGTGKIDRTNVSDLNEEGNKAEALNNRYIQLMEELDQAESAGDDARAEQLRDELAAVAVLAAEADKRARQQVKTTAGNKGVQVDKETDDAVQEPSAEEVDVRQRAGNGKKVGKGNAQGQAATQSAKTEAERAQEAWDKVASQYPNAPKFADLTDEQRETFIEFGEENWTADDVQNELIKLAKGGMKFGKGTDRAAVKNPYTANELLSEISKFVRADIPGRKLMVVDSVEALLKNPDADIRAVAKALSDAGAFGVAVDGRAYLIANRIEKGRGRAKFMHEVGAHLGLENLLPKALYDKLTQQIVNWAKKGDGSVESDLAIKAAERVMNAGTAKEDQRAEMLAYFIEEAVQAGIDPTADVKGSSALRAWFRTLWAAFKIAVRKLGFKPESMNAQDVVNLAFGAARLEIAGTWHGTAAKFRNFRNKYIGSGEGATAYGWGTYLAQRTGIAKGYWEADVARKTPYGPRKATYDGVEIGKASAQMNAAVGPVYERMVNYDVDAKTAIEAAIKALEKAIANRELSVASARKSKLAGLAGLEANLQMLKEDLETTKSLDPEKFALSDRVAPEGNLMRVDTAVDDELVFDYDKPLSKQSPAVMDVLYEVLEPVADEIVDRTNRDIPELTGRDIFGTGENDLGLLSNLIMDDALSLKPGQDAQFDRAVQQGKFHEAASHFLRVLGIQGIKFFDAKSRGTATDAISYNGRSYNRDDLRDAARKARNTGNDSKAMAFLVLKDVLRNGLDETKKALEAKVAEYEQMYFATAMQSAARYNVKVDKDQELADAKAKVQRDVYQAKQLAWLNANEKNISLTQLPRTRNLIVFDDKDIFRVGAETAADRQRMKFGVESSIERLPAQLQAPTRAVTTNTWSGVKKAGLALAITEDVVKLAQKTMKSAVDYLKAQYDQQATRLKFELQVEKILQQYDKLPKHVQGTGENSANRLIHDMTFEGKWGFVPSYNQNATLDNAMVQRFNAMPASAQQLIRDVFEHGHNALVAKQDAVKAAADKVFAARIADAQGDKKELAEIALERKSFDEKFARILKIKDNKPYAYLGRYGNFVAVAKSNEFMEAEKLSANGDLDATKWLKENESNPDHYMVSFAETQAEADRMAADWKGSGKFGQTYASEKLDSSAYIGGGDLFLAFKRMENMITRKAKNELVGGTVLEGMRKLLADMYLASVAESSAHTSSLARKNIAGADMDMMRNLATRGRADAHFLAALQHGDEVTDAMDRMIDERKDNPRESTPVLNELLKRQAQSMEYKLPGTLAQNLTQLSTVYFLSTSPAFYLQQLLQTAVLSLPFMAGRLGYFRSVRAIQQAYGDIRDLVKGLGVNEHVDFDKAPADVRAMLQTLVGMGKIDIGIDSDAKARSSDQGPMSKVMRKLQGVNTRIETINRATAAIAAYRAYLQKYGSDKTAAAAQYAADVVSNTHGSYDGFNTPRALSSDVGRVVGQFKRFQIIQLSMLGKLIHTAFKGASAEEKAVAKASLKYITSHMAVLGGALGVPFVSQLGNILVNIFGDDDEPKDLEQKLRELIGNEAVADLVLRGVPAAAGLESLGKKLAMENVASILPFTDVNLADRDALTKVYVSLLGPAAALSLKMADGLGMARKGEYYKGLELMLPNGVSNVMKAGRFATEGVTMRNGDSVLGPDGVSMVDAAFQAVGLPTSTITDRQRIQTVVAETDKFYEDRAAQVKLDYTRAFKKGDSGAMQDAREEWMQLQDARSRNGYTRQPLSTLFRAPMEQVKRERNTAGGVEFNKNNRRFVESLSQ